MVVASSAVFFYPPTADLKTGFSLIWATKEAGCPQLIDVTKACLVYDDKMRLPTITACMCWEGVLKK